MMGRFRRPASVAAQKEEMRLELRALIAEARRNGKWLVCDQEGRWFHPDELAAENERGRYIYSVRVWRLAWPEEREAHLQEAIHRAQDALAAFRERYRAGEPRRAGAGVAR